jgi:antitoxin component YwqK of YwqJK toxin-antitoxin module
VIRLAWLLLIATVTAAAGVSPVQARSGLMVTRSGSWISHEVLVRSTRGASLHFGGDGELRSCPLTCGEVARVERLPDGSRQAYDAAGELVAIYGLVDGRRHGPMRVWADGMLVVDGAFVAGQPHGLWREWNRDGSPLLEVTFIAGLLEGASMAVPAHPDGLVERGSWRAGVEHGVFTTTDAHGQLYSRQRYDQGRQHGDEELWHGGQRTLVIPWIDGRRAGAGERRMADGALVREIWVDDRLDAIEPRPPSYGWNPGQVDFAGGPMFGGATTVQLRLDLALVWGRARSRNGLSARGGYLGVGPQGTIDFALAGNNDDPAITLGPAIELGWASGAYGRRTPGVHVYVRAAPFYSSHDAHGLRLGIGVTAPAMTMRAYRWVQGEYDHNEREPPELGMIADAMRFLTAPVWSLDHLEVAVEVVPDLPERLGVLLGWGL